jgi:hypothetical protein
MKVKITLGGYANAGKVLFECYGFNFIEIRVGCVILIELAIFQPKILYPLVSCFENDFKE